MDLVKTIKTLALKNVLADGKVLQADPQYHLRTIFRWYSKEFHTPLHEVERLPLIEVLTHYFESTYEDMEEERLNTERQKLIETDEERRARAADGEMSDLEFLEKAQDEVQQAKQKQAALAAERGKSEPIAEPAPVSNPLRTRDKPSSLPVAKEETVIRMTFLSDSEFSNEVEADTLGKK